MPPRSRPGARRFLAELESVLASTIRGARRASERPRPSPETLHRLHRDLRRLRVGLAVWAGAASPKVAAELRRDERRVRRLARVVGRARDPDVALAVLAPHGPGLGRRDAAALAAARGRIGERGDEARRELRRALRRELDSGLFDQLLQYLSVRSARPSTTRLLDNWRELRADRGTSLRRAHRRARRRPSGNRLHRLRIRVRTWRHLSDLAPVVGPAGAAPGTPTTIHRLQRDLGRLHDLEVVGALARKGRTTGWGRRLREERRRRRRRLLRHLRSVEPDRLLGRTRPG